LSSIFSVSVVVWRPQRIIQWQRRAFATELLTARKPYHDDPSLQCRVEQLEVHDMRKVLAAAEGGDSRARLALAVYTRRVRQAIAALAVTLGGLDAIVFTGGVGEHAPAIRQATGTGLEFLGVELDSQPTPPASPTPISLVRHLL